MDGSDAVDEDGHAGDKGLARLDVSKCSSGVERHPDMAAERTKHQQTKCKATHFTTMAMIVKWKDEQDQTVNMITQHQAASGSAPNLTSEPKPFARPPRFAGEETRWLECFFYFGLMLP